MAHAYYPYELGSLGGDIHFDEDEPWSPNAKEDGGVDFFTVAVRISIFFSLSFFGNYFSGHFIAKQCGRASNVLA